MPRSRKLAVAMAALLVSFTMAPGGADDLVPLKPLRVVFFYSPSCEQCREVKLALPRLAQHWGARIVLEDKNTHEMDALNEMFAYEQYYDVEVKAPPAVFVGRRALVGARAIIAQLDRAIGEELAARSETFVPQKPDSQGSPVSADQIPPGILERYRGLGVGAVIAAGLIDGINPCAFTTIVFLLSSLSYLGRNRRELAVVGVAFTAAVFATYTALGLGLFGTVKTFAVSRGISAALAWATAFLAFALAIWSLKDAVQYARTHDAASVGLGLPDSVKSRIQRVIMTRLKTRGLAAGAVSVGFVVTLLESVCTGQVYLPTIIFVSRAPALRPHAIAYLLLYNLLFIAPLVVILGVAFFGVTSSSMGRFLRRHLAAMKLLLAFVFAGLGALVVATL